MHITLFRIILPILTEAAVQSSMLFEVFKVLFQGFITAGFGLLFALWLKHLWFDAEKKKKEDHERDLILEELKDLDRHFKMNKEVIEALLEHNRSKSPAERPSLLHARQLHVPGDYFILRKDSLHGLSTGYTQPVSRLNVVLRNRNVEAQLLEEMIQRREEEWTEVAALLEYMLKNFDRAIFPELNRCRRELGDPDQAGYVHPSEEEGYTRPKRQVLFSPGPFKPTSPVTSPTVVTSTTTITTTRTEPSDPK